MPRVLTCPHGHQWEFADEELPPGVEPVCPLCVSGREDPPPPAESAAPVAALSSKGETPPSVSILQWKTIPEAGAASQPESVRAPAGLPTVPGYEIRDVLGRGGMGVVYRAWQVRLKREVALKMILAGPHAGAEQLDRFRIEAEAAARLRHPNIVQIHEIGEQEGRPFLALEYVNGGSLADQLKQSLLPATVAAELVETLARAMHAAHGEGIIHRDLKSANILLAVSSQQSAVSPTESDRADRLTADRCSLTAIPKIADFGLAKQLGTEAGQTQSGAIMGTPSYMAPEQAEGKVKEIGPATDVYALGAILYEVLTGRPPFKESSVLETLEKVRSAAPDSPRSVQAKVPRDLETICLKCLRKDPRQRYATALALADDLRRFREGRPIQARPVGKAERLGKWARRNPILAILTGVLLVTVLGLAGVSGYLFWALQTLREQQQLVTAKSQLAEQQKKLATSNLWAALAVLEEAVPVMHPENVKVNPEFSTFRDEFLRGAMRFYDKLLANSDSPDVKNQRGVGRALYGKGLILLFGGKLGPAREQFEQALKVQEKLVADSPSEPGCLYELARTYQGLGDLFRAMKHPEEAVVAYRKAMNAFIRLFTEDGRALTEAAKLVHITFLTAKYEEAIALADLLINHLELLHQKEQRPDRRTILRNVLQELYAARAMFNMERGRFADALKDWDRRSKDDTSEIADKYQAFRAVTLGEVGRYAEAAAAVAALVQGKGKISGDALNYAVQAYSLAIQGARADPQLAPDRKDQLAAVYAARAVELLKKPQLISLLRDSPALRHELLTHEVFEPLRQFPAFQQWLRDFEAAKSKGEQRPPGR